ncbi:MAG: tRNA (adenosine(37)-N6)-dimethylallyltransferase MiaA [bacterium]
MKVLVITGPTGVGKTDVAVILARKFGWEIISADSRQVYRHLDIGTAKPPPELQKEIKFHMIDEVEPNRLYSAADFARDAMQVMKRLKAEGKFFFVVGGSGFYLRALFKPFFNCPGYNPNLRARLRATSASVLYKQLMAIDPERANQLHPNDKQRVVRALEVYKLTGRRFSEFVKEKETKTPFIPVYVVLYMERKRLYANIEHRFDQMIRDGLIDEVRRLKKLGVTQNSYLMNAYGYTELLWYLEGKISLQEAIVQAKKKTKRYARRQLTWCRGLKGAHWIEVTTAAETAEKLSINFLDLVNDKD